MLRPWEEYLGLLHEDTVTTKEVAQLKSLWLAAARDVAVQQVYTPVEHTPIEELRASTPVEFVTLLRLLQQRSGVTAGRLCARGPSAGPGRFGRSQVYSMTNIVRGVLPTKGEQVRAFAVACGLDQHQVEELLRVWVRLLAREKHRKTKRAAGAPRAGGRGRRGPGRELDVVRSLATVYNAWSHEEYPVVLQPLGRRELTPVPSPAVMAELRELVSQAYGDPRDSSEDPLGFAAYRRRHVEQLLAELAQHGDYEEVFRALTTLLGPLDTQAGQRLMVWLRSAWPRERTGAVLRRGGPPSRRTEVSE
ncbi:hypothetical protein GCM10010174_81170 [Kutzneria viridogrisea]